MADFRAFYGAFQRILFASIVGIFLFFGGTNSVFADPSYSFTVTTTSLAANDEFTFYISAQGTFYVDCGTGGTLKHPIGGSNQESNSSTSLNVAKTINKPNTSNQIFYCEYSSGGQKTIQFGGTAEAYKNSTEYAAIKFVSPTMISSLSGDLTSIFGCVNVSGTTKCPIFKETFKGTTSLSSVPGNLFASITVPGSYMFDHTFENSAITQINSGLFSNLTTGKEYLFYGTFVNCDGLSSVPSNLFAFSNSVQGQSGMFKDTFKDCNNLTQVPASLFSHVKSGSDYMFSGTFMSTGLTSIQPNLFYLDTDYFYSGADYLFENTFKDCTGLTQIPATLFSHVVSEAIGLFYGTFENTGLTSVPSNLFNFADDYATGTSPADYMFSRTFYGCSAITQINGNLFSHVEIAAPYMFENTFAFTGLTSVPGNLFYFHNNNVAGEEGMFWGTFSNCANLTQIPSNLFSHITDGAEHLFNGTFGSTGLTSVPVDLFYFNGNYVDGFDSMFANTFSNCASLPQVPGDLFLHVISGAESLFNSTFYDCVFTQIPSNLFYFNGNYVDGEPNMFATVFSGCNSLTSLPENLFSHVTSCASNMFAGAFSNCNGFNNAYIPPSMFLGILANEDTTSGACTNMFGRFFNNLLTTCPDGTTQYTTGFESQWNNGQVACVPTLNYSCPNSGTVSMYVLGSPESQFQSSWWNETGAFSGTDVSFSSYGDVTIEPLCTDNQGTVGAPGTPSSNNGVYCWCRVTSYTGNSDVGAGDLPWVYFGYMNSVDYNQCMQGGDAGCLKNCASMTSMGDYFRHALYTTNECGYKVKYKCSNDAAPVPSNTLVTTSEPYALTHASVCNPKSGYHLNLNGTIGGGWNCVAQNNGITPSPLTAASGIWPSTAQSDYTCTAQWAPNVVKLLWNSNGGTPVSILAPNSCTYNTSGTISSITIPQRTGYTFGGWVVDGWDECGLHHVDTGELGTAYASISLTGSGSLPNGSYGGATPATYDLFENGQWGVSFSYGDVIGTSVCHQTAGEPGGTAPLSDLTNTGACCWCQAESFIAHNSYEQCLLESISDTWVFGSCLSDPNICEKECALTCAQSARTDMTFRKRLYGEE